MNTKNLVGIDVGARELVVSVETEGSTALRTATFENTSSGHKKLAKFITKKKKRAQVCMEATGVYHFELALYLNKLETIDIMVVNPKAIKYFAIASMQRAKTDPLDSRLILEYIKKMEFKKWCPPSENKLILQAINRRISQLKNEITREQGRIHACEFKNDIAKDIENDIAVNIRHIKKRIKLLEDKAMIIINEEDELKEKFDLLISIKGIARVSAIQILSELVCLPEDMRGEQWVAHSGLDPVAVQSGESINKPSRISKAGNKYLRTAFYMPAWVAVQNELHVKAFYNKLIDAGKKPMQAIVAVMRKLLLAIWGMFNSNTKWDGEKFYKIA